MYTSCGWFFEDISGIETTQVIQYAARTLQLAEEIGDENLEDSFIKILERAPSNITEIKNGATVYELFVKPALVSLRRVCEHYAISSLFEEYPETTKIYSFVIESEIYGKAEVGKYKLATGKARIKSEVTLEDDVVNFAVLYFGDHNLNGGAHKFEGDESFFVMQKEIQDAFFKTDIPEVIRLMDKHFGTHKFSLRHLFRDEQIKVLSIIEKTALEETEIFFRQIYEHQYPIMHFMGELCIPIPKPFIDTVEFILNTDLQRVLEKEDLDLGQLHKLISESKKWHLELDKPALSFIATSKINALMERLANTPKDIHLMTRIGTTLKVLEPLSLELNLWKAQNTYFSIGKKLLNGMRERAEKEPGARRWIECFDSLGNCLYVKNV
jgi:hypothetical protein